jgi:hypothetical protein
MLAPRVPVNLLVRFSHNVEMSDKIEQRMKLLLLEEISHGKLD